METFADLVTEKIKVCDRADLALHTALAEILRSRAEISELRESLVALRAQWDAGAYPDAAPPPSPSEEVGDLPPLRSPVGKIIVEALEAAGDAGLSGMALNKIVAEKGFQKDTSEKVKLSLKKSKRVRHDRLSMHWYAIGFGPKNIPGES